MVCMVPKPQGKHGVSVIHNSYFACKSIGKTRTASGVVIRYTPRTVVSLIKETSPQRVHKKMVQDASVALNLGTVLLTKVQHLCSCKLLFDGFYTPPIQDHIVHFDH